MLTTRKAANAAALEHAIKAQGGDSMIVELDLVSHIHRQGVRHDSRDRR